MSNNIKQLWKSLLADIFKTHRQEIAVCVAELASEDVDAEFEFMWKGVTLKVRVSVDPDKLISELGVRDEGAELVSVGQP